MSKQLVPATARPLPAPIFKPSAQKRLRLKGATSVKTSHHGSTPSSLTPDMQYGPEQPGVLSLIGTLSCMVLSPAIRPTHHKPSPMAILRMLVSMSGMEYVVPPDRIKHVGGVLTSLSD